MALELTLDSILNNDEIQTYLDFTDEIFSGIGYKEHGKSHSYHASETAGQILKHLGYSQKEQELAKVAAYLHDIGNLISKTEHDQSGAIMFLNLVDLNSVCDKDIFAVATAIGNHEEKNTDPVSPIAAAVVLGDKTDVRHERLRGEEDVYVDKHSRVIAACRKVELKIDKEKKIIALWINIDVNICSVMDYFEIFMPRTKFCTRASRVLGCDFELYINKDKFL